jgi:hypothetical protein
VEDFALFGGHEVQGDVGRFHELLSHGGCYLCTHGFESNGRCGAKRLELKLTMAWF